MFGMGLGEIVTVAVVLLILVRPREIPRLMRRLGRVYGQLMEQIDAVKSGLAAGEPATGRGSDAESREGGDSPGCAAERGE